MVLVGAGVGLGQAPRGVDGAGENVEHRARATLAAQVGVHQGGNPLGPGHFHAGSSRQDDHGLGVGADHGLDEFGLSVG